MSRSARWLAVAVATALVAGPGGAAEAVPSPAPSDATGPVDDMVGPVDDMAGPVESLDGSESETKDGNTVTVALTSDVLFALDKADLTKKATVKLEGVAERIKNEAVGEVVKIEGHTDDQGGDGYNKKLSLKRAQAVQNALTKVLSGHDVTFEAAGHGETKPRVPNAKKGKPIEKNRAKNRRVEIIFDVRQ